jgi:hypothetical protein
MSYTTTEFDKPLNPTGTPFWLKECNGTEPDESPTFIVQAADDNEQLNKVGAAGRTPFERIAEHLAKRNDLTPDQCRFYEVGKDGTVSEHEFSNYRVEEGRPVFESDLPVGEAERAPKEQVTRFDHEVKPLDEAAQSELEKELDTDLSKMEPGLSAVVPTLADIEFSSIHREEFLNSEELQKEVTQYMNNQEQSHEQAQQADVDSSNSHDI